MTVESQISKVRYVGNGQTRDFPVPFPVRRGEHLRLVKPGADNKDVIVASGYEILGAGTAAVTVRMAAPPPLGEVFTLARVLPLTQQMDLENGGAFDAEVLEASADLLEMQIQQVAEEVSRAVKISLTDAEPPLTAEEFYYWGKTTLNRAEGAAANAQRSAGEAENSALKSADFAAQAENAAGRAKEDAQKGAEHLARIEQGYAEEMGRLVAQGDAQVLRLEDVAENGEARLEDEGTRQRELVHYEGGAQFERIRSEGEGRFERVRNEGEAQFWQLHAEGEAQNRRVILAGDVQFARLDAEGAKTLQRYADILEAGDAQHARVLAEGERQRDRVHSAGDAQYWRVADEGEFQYRRFVQTSAEQRRELAGLTEDGVIAIVQEGEHQRLAVRGEGKTQKCGLAGAGLAGRGLIFGAALEQILLLQSEGERQTGRLAAVLDVALDVAAQHAEVLAHVARLENQIVALRGRVRLLEDGGACVCGKDEDGSGPEWFVDGSYLGPAVVGAALSDLGGMGILFTADGGVEARPGTAALGEGPEAMGEAAIMFTGEGMEPYAGPVAVGPALNSIGKAGVLFLIGDGRERQ